MSNTEGKVVVITGASSGIGKATARMLATKGAHVMLGARRTDLLERLAKELTAAGGSVRVRSLDVVSRSDVQAFVDFAKVEFGRIDIMVNNAGVMPLSPLASLKVDEWDRMIDVNIRGVLHGIAAVLPGMEAQGFGQIINISSIGGLSVTPTAAVYCATKSAVRDLGRAEAGSGQDPRDRGLPRRDRVRTGRQHLGRSGPERDEGIPPDRDSGRCHCPHHRLRHRAAGRRRRQRTRRSSDSQPILTTKSQNHDTAS